MWTLLGAVALGAPAEEVVVYSDPFVRWDQTRWLVQTELLLPFATVFARDDVHGFTSHAFQIRAVVACDKDARLSRRRYEVRCELEDVGLQVTTRGRWRSAREVAAIQEVLDEVDDHLTGASVQLQVDDEGQVRNVDLEGWTPRNERERDNQESLRQVVARLMAGFHLQVPETAEDHGAWQERDSLLLKMPSSNGVRGFTTIDHTLLESDGHRVISSVGDGTVSLQIPYVREAPLHMNQRPPEPIQPMGVPAPEPLERPPLNGLPGMVGAPPIKFPPPDLFVTELEMLDPGYDVVELADSAVVDLEAVYALRHAGVSVFDPDQGFVSERIWVVRGDPTPSSAGGVQTGPYWSTGRLQLLGPDDHPDVGATVQVVVSATELPDGLAPWVDMDLL